MKKYQDIMQYESDIWAAADLLIAAGIKQSKFPEYMMPYFALMMLESRLRKEQLHSEFKKAVKKYIRVNKLDALEKTFYEDNLEQLFEDFDSYLNLQRVEVKKE